MKFQIIPQPWGVGLETTICQKYQCDIYGVFKLYLDLLTP